MVRKTYAIAAILQNDDSWTVFKLGEYPPFGPHLPARVISLIGPDREYFLLGRRAETYGLGIAAFAYYRRVVENQKERILSQMAGAAKRLGASTEKIALFERAQAETQFSNAIEILKPAIPATLLIKGQNPLSLLYSPLSKGLHELTDEQCL
jgi:hypothetical protein